MTVLSKALAGVLAAASFAAGAQSVMDGSAPLLCAATSTAVCARDEDCTRGSAESVNLPVMWRVDFAHKTVESLHHGGERRHSGVTATSADGGFLVIQGAEQGLGWSMSVEQATGAMVLIGGRDQGFVVFGTCTSL